MSGIWAVSLGTNAAGDTNTGVNASRRVNLQTSAAQQQLGMQQITSSAKPTSRPARTAEAGCAELAICFIMLPAGIPEGFCRSMNAVCTAGQGYGGPHHHEIP